MKNAAPAFNIPSIHTIVSKERLVIIQTISFLPIPLDINRFAKQLALLFNSVYVNFLSSQIKAISLGCSITCLSNIDTIVSSLIGDVVLLNSLSIHFSSGVIMSKSDII